MTERTPKFCYRALGIVTASLLAACGAPTQPIAPPGAMSQELSQGRDIVVASSVMPKYKVSRPLLYVASFDLTGTPLAIYDASANDPEPIATISDDIDNSTGDCIDQEGTLYVANDASPGWISEYALGQTKAMRVITEGINSPAYCAIDASGNLWVTNIGLDNVTEFLKGSTRPHTTITKGLKYPDGIAIDGQGNLYIGNLLAQYSQPSYIQVYRPGQKTPSRTITDGVTWPVGLTVDAHDTLYVTNATLSGSIAEYRFGESKPYRRITDGLVYPEDVVASDRGWLYVANSGQRTTQQAILEFKPDSLKPSSREIINGFFNPQGLAYYAGLPNNRHRKSSTLLSRR